MTEKNQSCLIHYYLLLDGTYFILKSLKLTVVNQNHSKISLSNLK